MSANGFFFVFREKRVDDQFKQAKLSGELGTPQYIPKHHQHQHWPLLCHATSKASLLKETEVSSA